LPAAVEVPEVSGQGQAELIQGRPGGQAIVVLDIGATPDQRRQASRADFTLDLAPEQDPTEGPGVETREGGQDPHESHPIADR
jgi:hypothetical protein